MTEAAGPAPRQPGRWRDVDGILLLDKPVGLSSNAALQRARRAFQARKAGHTGSLDPLASGLLPVCFGQATKASAMLLDSDKTYLVTASLGSRTATGDAEGEVVEQGPLPLLTAASVEAALQAFRGEISQVPPMHSALKHQGQRLYRLARQGVEVERAPRTVWIRQLDLRRINGASLELEVRCSKGTYIRSLVEDLARAMGSCGHVSWLHRTRLGPFDGQPVHTLEAVEAAAAGLPDALQGLLLPVDAGLGGWPAVELGADEQASVLQGKAVFAAGPGGERVRMYGPGSIFLGIGRMAAEGGRLSPERIMVRLPDPDRPAP